MSSAYLATKGDPGGYGPSLNCDNPFNTTRPPVFPMDSRSKYSQSYTISVEPKIHQGVEPNKSGSECDCSFNANYWLLLTK